MGSQETAEYINNKTGRDDITKWDVLFLSSKGIFSTYSHLSFVCFDRFNKHRSLYKVSGLRYVWENIGSSPVKEICATYLSKNERYFETLFKGGTRLTGFLSLHNKQEGIKHISIDTYKKQGQHNLTNIRNSFFSAEFSYDNKESIGKEIYNGICRSNILSNLAHYRDPTTDIFQKTLLDALESRNGKYIDLFNVIEFYPFQDIDDFYISLQYAYDDADKLEDDRIEIDTKNNIEQLFLFHRDEIDEYIKKLTKNEVEEEKIIENLRTRITELESQLQVQKESAVDSEPVLGNAKAYDVRERETHLLIIGALSNLLAENKQKYQKGNGGINQSAISKDIETEIIELLQPATKTRTIDTIRPRIRESLNLITKAE